MFCDLAGIIRKLMIPKGGDLTSQTMPSRFMRDFTFFVFFAEIKPAAYSAHQIKNAPRGASFVL